MCLHVLHIVLKDLEDAFFFKKRSNLLEMSYIFLFTTDLAIVFSPIACVSGTVVTG